MCKLHERNEECCRIQPCAPEANAAGGVVQVIQSVVPEDVAQRRLELVPRLLPDRPGCLGLGPDAAPCQVIRHRMRAVRAAQASESLSMTCIRSWCSTLTL